MTDITALKELLERVQKAEGARRTLDWHIAEAFDTPEPWPVTSGMWPPFMEGSKFDKAIPRYTSSLDACVALIEKVLPDWWHTAGLCSLTGHASIGPDYNGPAGERLRREFPVELFDGKFDADLAPGDGKHRTCYALLHCILSALIAKEESGA